MRSIIQFCMAAMCIALVGGGLYMSMDSMDDGVVLDSAGTPGRLISGASTATAFFELDGDRLELTMLFSNEDDPANVFRTRVVLANGQSHSIVVAGDDDDNPQRFVFQRDGETVTMSLAPAASAKTTFVAGE